MGRLLIATGLFVPVILLAEPKPQNPRVAAVGADLVQRVANGGFAGAVLIARCGEPIFRGACGDANNPQKSGSGAVIRNWIVDAAQVRGHRIDDRAHGRARRHAVTPREQRGMRRGHRHGVPCGEELRHVEGDVGE